MYIYIYIHRERERESMSPSLLILGTIDVLMKSPFMAIGRMFAWPYMHDMTHKSVYI